MENDKKVKIIKKTITYEVVPVEEPEKNRLC